MPGQHCFLFLCPIHLVFIILLFAHLALSGAVEPPQKSSKAPSVSAGPPPVNTRMPAGRHPPTDDVDDQLPYFFILHLPNMLADEPTWSDWSGWSACGVSCGAPSRQVRRRHCQRAAEGACPGQSTQWRPCRAIPCPKETPPRQGGQVGTPQRTTRPVNKGQEKHSVQEMAKEAGKMAVNGSVEHIEGLAQRNGVVDEKEPEVENEDDQQISISFEEWHECPSPCPYKIQLRRRWCYLGHYCIGAVREIRVCASGIGGLVSCGTVNTTDITEFSDVKNRSAPWTDTHIGWSMWTPWTWCSSECGYHLQVVNRSRTCLRIGGQVSCLDQDEMVRVCRGEPEASVASSPICGPVEDLDQWKLTDESVVRRRFFFPSSSRLIHAIVIFVLFAPPIILLFYWLLSRAHKPRYESLPSASAAGESAVDANGQPTISADVTSALGPNHVTVETDPNAWKTV